MQVLFFVLNRTECLDRFLAALSEAGIKGATVINSTGMAHTLAHHEDDISFSALRHFFSGTREDNRTIFTVIEDEKIPVVKKIISEVVGDLSKPDTGILFGFPVTFADGITDFQK